MTVWCYKTSPKCSWLWIIPKILLRRTICKAQGSLTSFSSYFWTREIIEEEKDVGQNWTNVCPAGNLLPVPYNDLLGHFKLKLIHIRIQMIILRFLLSLSSFLFLFCFWPILEHRHFVEIAQKKSERKRYRPFLRSRKRGQYITWSARHFRHLGIGEEGCLGEILLQLTFCLFSTFLRWFC